MKKFYIVFFFVTLGWNVTAQNIAIPDPVFKAILIANTHININMDSEIQVSEAASYSDSIDVNSLNITNLSGIEAFTSIVYLDCSFNQLFTLDVSSNTALKYLNCQTCQLTDLDISHNTALRRLICSNNQLGTLDLLNNTELISLTCASDQLTTLDLTASTALIEIDCDGNQLTGLNISANSALTKLNCSGNLLTALSIATNTSLTDLICNDNQLTSFYVPSNTALVNLWCYSNQLTGLNIASNNTLENIYTSYNKLTSLDVSPALALKSLDCCFNLFTVLDVSSNAFLVGLGCNDTPLKSLNIKNGNNVNFTSFYTVRDSNLTCIQVDDPVSFMTDWGGVIDSTASFNSHCLSTPIVNITNGILSSSSITDNQWYLDGKLISGATVQTYTPVVNGIYTVQLKSAGNITSAVSEGIIVSNIITSVQQNSIDHIFSVFPNPSNGIFYLKTVEFEKLKIKNIEVFNVLGESVYSQVATASNHKIDLSDEQNGIYIAKIISDQGIYTVKLFLNK